MSESFTVDPVVAESRRMIRLGSKSFAGAARLLAPDRRDSVYQLYAWCRYCDDRIDFQDLGRGAPAGATAAAHDRLKALRAETRRALDGEPVDEVVFVALQRVVRRHRIPDHHPMELLQGFEMDVQERRYTTLDDVLSYCYHVAGVVGVMMAYVMGAEGEDTLDRAADLGIALQMTNIARDVMDDASAGRIYLPQAWLDDAGVPTDDIRERHHRDAVHGVVRRLLAEADRYYRSATVGLARLPLRSAWSIATRAVVSKRRKLICVARGGLQALRLTSLGPRGVNLSRSGLWNRPSTADSAQTAKSSVQDATNSGHGSGN
jgi:phytoene synthase